MTKDGKLEGNEGRKEEGKNVIGEGWKTCRKEKEKKKKGKLITDEESC